MLDGKLDQQILQLGEIKYLALLGKFVGEPTVPIDLLVVGQISSDRLKEILASVEKAHGIEINFSLLTPEEFKYRQEIGDRFLHSIIEGRRKVIVDRLHERG